MYKVKILPSAKQDIKEAAKWYNDLQKGLGLRFTSFVRNKMISIATNPFAYSIKYHNVRTASLDVFPYMVHFTIVESNILVQAVFHTSRKPLSE